MAVVGSRSALGEPASSRSLLAARLDPLSTTAEAKGARASEVIDQAMPAPVAAKHSETSRVLMMSNMDVPPKVAKRRVVDGGRFAPSLFRAVFRWKPLLFQVFQLGGRTPGINLWSDHADGWSQPSGKSNTQSPLLRDLSASG